MHRNGMELDIPKEDAKENEMTEAKYILKVNHNSETEVYIKWDDPLQKFEHLIGTFETKSYAEFFAKALNEGTSPQKPLDVNESITAAHDETHCSTCETPLHRYEMSSGKCDSCRYPDLSEDVQQAL